MTDENDEKTNWAKLPKAKRHAFLAEIDQALKGCHKKETFEIFGTRYTLRTLDPADESWTLQFIQGNDYYSFGKMRRAPTVAAALVAIGPADESKPTISVEELFTVADDMPEVTKQLVKENKYFERDWRRTEILRWLSEPDKHEDLTKLLYDRYLSLSGKRAEALVALSPLSKRTPTGESSDTSSPERGASSPTPLSGS